MKYCIAKHSLVYENMRINGGLTTEACNVEDADEWLWWRERKRLVDSRHDVVKQFRIYCFGERVASILGFAWFQLYSVRILYTRKHQHHGIIKPCWQDITCCQTGWTTGCSAGRMLVYTIQPVVKPVEQPVEQSAASCKQTFNRLFNRFDNRLFRSCKRGS